MNASSENSGQIHGFIHGFRTWIQNGFGHGFIHGFMLGCRMDSQWICRWIQNVFIHGLMHGCIDDHRWFTMDSHMDSECIQSGFIDGFSMESHMESCNCAGGGEPVACKMGCPFVNTLTQLASFPLLLSCVTVIIDWPLWLQAYALL